MKHRKHLNSWVRKSKILPGLVLLDTNNLITKPKKTKPEEVFSNLINAGSYILEDSVFDIMPNGKHSLERDIFHRWLSVENYRFSIPGLLHRCGYANFLASSNKMLYSRKKILNRFSRKWILASVRDFVCI